MDQKFLDKMILLISDSEEIQFLKDQFEQAALYRWLRDRPYKYKFTRSSEKVFVMGRNSRLYAIQRLDGLDLDLTLKEEILNDMIEYLGYEQDIEGDIRFSIPDWRFSDERYNELKDQAIQLLKMTSL